MQQCDENDSTPVRWSRASPIVDGDANVRYVPVLSYLGHVGYRCEWLDTGRVTYLYLNPSTGGSGGDHHPNIFIYEGETFLPEEDPPVCYIDLEEPS